MSQAYLKQGTRAGLPVAEPVRARISPALLALIPTVALAALSLYALMPPAAVGVNAPPTEFSAGRALPHVKAIAERPHPIGTAEHAAVRDYLLRELTAAGAQPEVQEASALYRSSFGPYTGGTVENVVARLKGEDNSRAVLIVGHYDTVPTSSGASDNGAAVAAMLETLNALRAGAPLKNDIIFLFSDGEEAGSLGARAFVAEHPWAKDVGVVLNFDARGVGGQSFMFETSKGNGRLIEAFAAAPHPAGNSLANSIYRLVKNDTDLSVFKRAGYAGLNFAYIDGVANYHTRLDDVGRLDERSLQHHGSNMLALARGLGNQDLRGLAAGDAVYFNLLGPLLVRYASRWVWPLVVLNMLLFLGLLVFGFLRRRLKPSGLALGFLALLASLVTAPLLTWGVWGLLSRWVNGPGHAPSGGAYHDGLYLLSFVALAVAVVSALYALVGRRVGPTGLLAGGLLWWLLCLVATALFAPGASYLFTWPLLCALIGLAYLLLRREVEGEGRKLSVVLVLVLCTAPAILIAVPTVQQLLVSLTLNMLAPAAVVVALLMGLLMPHLIHASRGRRWLLPVAAALISLGCGAAAVVGSADAARNPRQNQLFYWLNADTQQAVWTTFDRKPDVWTAQFLTERPDYRDLSDLIPAATQGLYPRAEAPSLALNAPAVTLLGDDTRDGVRTLRLHLASAQPATSVAVYLASEAEVVRTLVEDKEAEQASAPPGRARDWGLYYKNLPPAGINVTMGVKSTAPVELRVVAQAYGLPVAAGAAYTPRPASFIPAPDPFNDSTLVSRTFVY